MHSSNLVVSYPLRLAPTTRQTLSEARHRSSSSESGSETSSAFAVFSGWMTGEIAPLRPTPPSQPNWWIASDAEQAHGKSSSSRLIGGKSQLSTSRIKLLLEQQAIQSRPCSATSPPGSTPAARMTLTARTGRSFVIDCVPDTAILYVVSGAVN
jgi:hypothetical protein